jgi:hypothetical protein
MSTPYTLVEAFELLRQRQQKPRNDQGSNNNAVDILGIVSNISTSRTPVTSKPYLSLSGRSRFRRCQIWLLDESLDTALKSSNGAFVGSRFVLYESSEIARTLKEKIKAGDILRFNRVALKSYGGSSQFQFSSQDPEPGITWFRLGSIDCHGRLYGKEFNIDVESTIPKSMITSKERVAELADWYNNKIKMIHPPSMPNALPTRKRQLDEIQSSVGILSNITVRVLCVRSEPTIEENTSYSSGEIKRKNRTRPPVAFASFTDDSGVVMSFIDSSGRFLLELRSAQKKSHTTRLVMTNVSTEHQSNLQGLATSGKEIILVPTEMTTARLISEENILNHPNTKSSCINDFDITQTQETTHGTDITMHSSIKDISVNGLSLKTSRSVFSSSSKFLRTITRNDESFNEAIIHLEKNDDQVCNTGILATPDVLKILCGSLDVAELSNDEKLCMHSMRFLQDLLQGHIVLDWTLNKNKQNDVKIVKATLHLVPE